MRVRRSEFRVRRKEHPAMNPPPEVSQVQRMVYPFLALQTAIFFDMTGRTVVVYSPRDPKV
jgi:hypothetical protein